MLGFPVPDRMLTKAIVSLKGSRGQELIAQPRHLVPCIINLSGPRVIVVPEVEEYFLVLAIVILSLSYHHL
jgi:hypothetical protein